MKLWGWKIRIEEYQGKADVNIKFGIFIESKDFIQFKIEFFERYLFSLELFRSISLIWEGRTYGEKN